MYSTALISSTNNNMVADTLITIDTAYRNA